MSKMKQKSFLCALTACVAALLTGTQVYAQQPGGPPASVVFYSARDGHSNNQVYAMNPGSPTYFVLVANC
jgi:hypothetical protein